MNQRQIETISGVVADLAGKPTRTGRSMITFTLSGKNCKAFDKVAGTVQSLTGEQIELQVIRGSYAGLEGTAKAARVNEFETSGHGI